MMHLGYSQEIPHYLRNYFLPLVVEDQTSDPLPNPERRASRQQVIYGRKCMLYKNVLNFEQKLNKYRPYIIIVGSVFNWLRHEKLEEEVAEILGVRLEMKKPGRPKKYPDRKGD
jgi:hypothetical protein